MAKRARIVSLAAEGLSNRHIGELVDMHYNQVGLWRQRYEEYGVAGLEDHERSGRPPTYGHDDVLTLVALATEEPPDGASRWSMVALAAAMAERKIPISASQCWRICNSLDLKPWQVRSWMTSHDPEFWERAADVCGLYLEPPEASLVISVDEKTGIQAKSRINATKPPIPGIPARQEFEYRRNGTATLFAALDVHGGEVTGWVTDSCRSTNFVAFLTELVAKTPAHLDLHFIADNLSAHNTPLVVELQRRSKHPQLGSVRPEANLRWPLLSRRHRSSAQHARRGPKPHP